MDQGCEVLRIVYHDKTDKDVASLSVFADSSGESRMCVRAVNLLLGDDAETVYKALVGPRGDSI